MNIIKNIYDKLKSSYDDFWIGQEKQMASMTVEERMYMYNSLSSNNFQ